MAPELIITLSDDEREKLAAIRDRHSKAYMRERASAILKIAEGQSGREVAREGLLKERRPDTVYEWVHRWEAEGVEGLRIRDGRGRKPAFFPEYTDEKDARQALLLIIRRDPHTLGYERARWRLQDIMGHCDWLQLETGAGLHRLLKRLSIRYKQGRHYIHSPDPYYEDKRSLMALSLLRAQYAPERYVFLFQDEMTFYHVPSLAKAYEAQGHCQARAQLPYDYERQSRVVGALNAMTGQVHYRQQNKIGVAELGDFYHETCATYPGVQVIFIAQDNAPFHFHPDLLARLQPQHFRWPLSVPASWPTDPSPRAIHDDLPICLLQLPTYASWLNPIEKLWRWLKQDVLHLHRIPDQWPILRHQVNCFLDRFSQGSPDLLHYVGLLPD